MKCQKNVKKVLIFFIIRNLLCRFSNFFSNFALVLFFWKLPAIAGHWVIQLYSKQIPLKVDYIWLINRCDYCRKIELFQVIFLIIYSQVLKIKILSKHDTNLVY